jgi:hypothetical protein
LANRFDPIPYIYPIFEHLIHAGAFLMMLGTALILKGDSSMCDSGTGVSQQRTKLGCIDCRGNQQCARCKADERAARKVERSA